MVVAAALKILLYLVRLHKTSRAGEFMSGRQTPGLTAHPVDGSVPPSLLQNCQRDSIHQSNTYIRGKSCPRFSTTSRFLLVLQEIQNGLGCSAYTYMDEMSDRLIELVMQMAPYQKVGRCIVAICLLAMPSDDVNVFLDPLCPRLTH